MREIRKGDMVSRYSYKNDIMFYVKKIYKSENQQRIAILKGFDIRIEADAPIEDLKLVTKEEKDKYENNIWKRINAHTVEKTINRRREIVYTGKILHLDGDRKYSDKSNMYYKKMGLNAVVKNIAENRQSQAVYRLLNIYKPDILVITGHDGIIKYRKMFDIKMRKCYNI